MTRFLAALLFAALSMVPRSLGQAQSCDDYNRTGTRHSQPGTRYC